MLWYASQLIPLLLPDLLFQANTTIASNRQHMAAVLSKDSFNPLFESIQHIYRYKRLHSTSKATTMNTKCALTIQQRITDRKVLALDCIFYRR